MRRLVLCVLLLLAAAPFLEAANRYDPRLRFRTISTPRFDIHYHQGEERLARRLAELAEGIAADLEPRLGRPRARVHVILVNQSDLANGWATPIPYNLIEIVAASPRHDSTIGNTSDWLRLVLTHEYTHVLHLERSRGFLGAVGRIFGRHPLFYPNLFTPPWQVEGLATYYESALTREGRVPAGDFRMVMRRAAAAGHFPALDVASNDIVQWPGGQTPYLYGAYFHQFLAGKYGEPALKELADATAGRLPFLGSRAFKKVFGKSLGALWDEYEASVTAGATLPENRAQRLTQHGFDVSDPWFSRDGRLFYATANPHDFPALMEWTASGPRQVATRVAGEQLTAATGGRVFFDQVEYVRSVALQSDLYVRAPDGAVRRLTREARAADPDLSPDAATLVCVVQTAEGRALATVPATGGVPATLIFEPGVDYASPRWSPDGRQIVAERRALEGTSEIVVVDAATGVRAGWITGSARGRNATPVWSPDGRQIFFASDRDGGPFRIFAIDRERTSLRRLTGIDSGHSPTLSPDGETLVFVGYAPAGYDLFSIPLDEAEWEPLDVEAAPMSASPSALAAPLPPAADRPYSPVSTLVPRFWTPVIEEEGDGVAVGAATAGFDALGRHTYVASAAWSTRARPDWYASYAYDRWRPTVFATVSDDVEPWKEGELRVRELNVGAAVAFRRVRRTHALAAAYHAAGETLDCAACDPPEAGAADRRAVRAAWTFDSSRRYGYSISDEQGFTAGASSEWTRKAFGADGDAGALVAELRGYRRAGPRHAALALRLAAARSWGDDGVRRVFAAGGSSAAQAAGLDFGIDAIALLRGFDHADATGHTAVVLNADYRVPLLWVERGVGTWPLFLRSLHGAVFADAGAAWEGSRTREDRRASAGVELSADIVVGYALPVTASVGVAARHDPTGRSGGATIFARIGRAF